MDRLNRTVHHVVFGYLMQRSGHSVKYWKLVFYLVFVDLSDVVYVFLITHSFDIIGKTDTELQTISTVITNETELA
jgi:hypothetical protein